MATGVLSTPIALRLDGKSDESSSSEYLRWRASHIDLVSGPLSAAGASCPDFITSILGFASCRYFSSKPRLNIRLTDSSRWAGNNQSSRSDESRHCQRRQSTYIGLHCVWLVRASRLLLRCTSCFLFTCRTCGLNEHRRIRD